MTQNQINYWKVMEERRHNIAMEQETARYNRVVNAQNQYALEEQKRHNLEQELIGLQQAKASMASASAAQTSAAAAMRNAEVRSLELKEAERVNSANITRQDLLAQMSVQETRSVISLNEAKSNLTYVQAETEAIKGGLYTVQTSLEQARTGLVTAQTWKTKVDMITESTKDVVDIIVGVSGLAALG